MSKDLIRVKRALISVSDKTGIVRLATELLKRNIEIVSTGGTLDFLKEHEVPVKGVETITNFPELLDGRLKTLHPKIHGGLLGVRENENHLSSMQDYNIPEIDLLIVNLYPFSKVMNSKASHAEIIENIDIGGPAMIRAGAKNHKYVSVLVDQQDYEDFINEFEENSGCTTLALRRRLAEIAFSYTAEYDGIISQWMSRESDNKEPRRLTISGRYMQRLRYGENPHQSASYYKSSLNVDIISASLLHQGKELSYNNLNDFNAAVDVIREFENETRALAVIVKHSNTCGVALKDNAFEAYCAAFECDRSSAFGGVVAFNTKIDKKTARAVCNIFTEIVIAPSADPGAIEEFSKKKNLRLVTIDKEFLSQKNEFQFRQISGGILVQDKDIERVIEADLSTVSRKNPSRREFDDMLFAWKVAKHIKSNAIVFAKNTATIGIGAGQMSRVDSVRIAINKAEKLIQSFGHKKFTMIGAVAASDAFFPFEDSILNLAKVGIGAVIQPGGSIKDSEVIEAANKSNMSMVFTQIRHFKH